MNRNRPAAPGVPLSDELAGVFARMSGLLLTTETVETSLSVLSWLAHETVPGSAGAGVSMIDGRRRTSSGSTDDRVRDADGLQYEFDEGPCLAAARTRDLVRIDDVDEDGRWPRWAEAVRPLGVRAVLSAPLVIGERALGAVKVYADHTHAFDQRSERLLTLFSAQAAVLVANVQSSARAEQLSEPMRQAIGDRDAVKLATGVLMGRQGLDERTALSSLVARSQQDGTTLAAAARAVVGSAARRRR